MNYCKKYFLKEITAIQAGYSIRGRIPVTQNGTLKIIQMKDIDKEKGIVWDNISHINPVSKNEPPYLNKNDIIFSSRGTRLIAVPITVETINTVAAPHLFVLIPNIKKVNPIYLSWYINQNDSQTYLKKNAGASIIMNVTRKVLENLPVLLPPLEKQEILAGYINAMHRENRLTIRLKEKRNQLIEKLLLNHKEKL